VKGLHSNLLERKLTRRMVRLQLITLALFFGLAIFPAIIYPTLKFLGDSKPLDPTVTAIFARSLGHVEGNTITVEQTKDLKKLLADYPHIWLYAVTRSGAYAGIGKIPELYHDAAPSLWLLESLEVRMVDNGEGGVLVRPERSAVGTVRVMTGDGPVVGVAAVVTGVSIAIALGIFAVIALVGVLFIPRAIRWELRGIKIAADQAHLIDVDSRGASLSTEDVPDEVRSLVEAVNAALGRLDESYEKRERFIAASAHELRTPIAILQTRIETAEPFPEQSRLMLDVARLASLTGQLLDLQRMDLGDGILEVVDIAELAENVVGDLAPLAIAAGYELSFISPGAAVLVKGDSGSLLRAMTNIIQNAIAYGGQRGEITVSVTQDGTIAIGDEGPGIPEAEREKVFEPFYRVKPSAQGAGLGLNLVDSIIRRHHGRVSIADSPAGGAFFVISLPVLPSR
jgi:signal transduction histidine kinase